MFFRQFSLSLIFAVFLSLYLCPFSLSLASTVIPLRSFVNSSCLLFPLCFFLFISAHSLSYRLPLLCVFLLSSILPVFDFRCLSFSLSLSILSVCRFHCRSSKFFRQYSLFLISAVFLSLYLCPFCLSLASTVVLPRSFVNSLCL